MLNTESSSAWSRLAGKHHGDNPSESGAHARRDHAKTHDYDLLDRHRSLLLTDEFYRVRGTAPGASGGGIHAPRLPQLLSGRALMGKVSRRGVAACASAGAAQGVGLRRFRDRPGVGAHRAFRGGGWTRGVGLGCRYGRALGAGVLPVAAIGEIMTTN